MKKLVFMLAMLFTVSSTFVSCRENPDPDTETEAELNNDELDVNDDIEDTNRSLDNNPAQEPAGEVPREEGPGTIEDDL